MSPKQWFETLFIGYRNGKNASKADAVARANPVRDKVEERVRGCFACAHRVQLQMSSTGKAPHKTGSFAVTQTLGLEISLAAVLFAVCGASRPNPLRWHALACGAGMFLFSLGVLVSG